MAMGRNRLVLAGALAWVVLISPFAWADGDLLPKADNNGALVQRLVEAALERTRHRVVYDGAYVALDYPNGDVAPDRGVCTDVVVRSFRAVGLDLQRLVHEDMRANFARYPSRRIWGLSRPDANIDHRRVPNLRVFFSRFGRSLPLLAGDDTAGFLPGDLVTWMLPGNRPHIGIVVNRRDPASGRYLVVHNIGWGPELGDVLLDFKMTGHYRYPQN